MKTGEEIPRVSKDHWYDGTFFDLFIAPNQDPVFAAIKELIPHGSAVLDVGCGTGRLALQLADRCSLVHAIDPSPRNIARAREIHARRGSPPSIGFVTASLEAYLSSPHRTYDYGVISYVLHEVEEAKRMPMLLSLAAASRRLVLADYRVPRGFGMMDAATEMVEFLAGRDHYRGFKSFVRTGGLVALVRSAGLVTSREQPCANRQAQVLFISQGPA
jgi:SAM-dependent methyltransferase